MASQSSYDDMSSPVDTPTTPQPVHSRLPGPHETLGRFSPTSLTMAGNSQALGGDSTSQNTMKYSSPGPMSSSMTPPPSSQITNVRQSITTPVARTATATPSILSSPPPTNTNDIKRGPVVDISRPPTAQEIAEASPEALRDMMQNLIATNSKLDNAFREARMEQAHYKLQNTLLTMESEEAIKHLEAEHELTRREVQVLQLAYQGRVDSNSPSPEYVAKLKSICKTLETENKTITRRLERAKRVIELKEDQLEAAKDTNDRLMQRIRENREHINIMRSPGGLFHIATPKPSSSSYPATPQQYHRTPQQTPKTGRSIREAREHGQEPFAALLLADRVLSKENNSAPSTPIVSRHPDPRTPTNRHNRGVQSLSSLPTTPRSARPGTANSTLLPSAQFMPHTVSRSTYTKRTPTHQPRERRRKSRDSTISAEDVEEIARAALEHRGREESEEIQESQASQSATEMLRADPRESFEVAASRTTTPNLVAEKSGLLQSKIFGTVTKPVVEKRKHEEHYGVDYSNKKMRAGEGIGLGIGFEASRV